MLCPRYMESRRDRNNFISFDPSEDLPLASHRKFLKLHIIIAFRRNDKPQGRRKFLQIYSISAQAASKTEVSHVEVQIKTS
jgi:hypothetical protein